MTLRFSGKLTIPSGKLITNPGVTLGPTDPFFNDVVLLVGFDGNFSDESNSNHSPTVVGSVTTGTTDAKFAGNEVGQFPGTSVETDYIDYAASSDFALQPQNDWTIELFVNYQASKEHVASLS